MHRLAQGLVDWGMLERSGFEYRLGMRAFELGSRVPRFRVLRDAARPFMERLHFATKEAVHLAVLDGLEVLYLEKVAAAHAAKPSRIAGRMPLHATSTGKVLLAFSPPSVLEEVVSRELNRITPHTTVAPGLLVEQIRQPQRLGGGAGGDRRRLVLRGGAAVHRQPACCWARCRSRHRPTGRTSPSWPPR